MLPYTRAIAFGPCVGSSSATSALGTTRSTRVESDACAPAAQHSTAIAATPVRNLITVLPFLVLIREIACRRLRRRHIAGTAGIGAAGHHPGLGVDRDALHAAGRHHP